MDAFQPGNFESRWYRFWESNRYFSPDHPLQKAREKVFTIIIPPPNVTGSLHVGHALVNTLQDVMIRWKRMSGYKTLWLPLQGLDRFEARKRIVEMCRSLRIAF